MVMRRLADRSNRVGFTLIELLVVIAIIAILGAILFPVFARARRKAKTTQCINNLKQIATAVRMYVDDHNGYGPRVCNVYGNGNPNIGAQDSFLRNTSGPYRDLNSYLKGDTLWQCPDPCDSCWNNFIRNEIDYRFNECLGYAYAPGKVYRPRKFDQCTRPAQFYLLSDRHSRHHYERSGVNSPTSGWVMLMVMVDGHVVTNVKPYSPEWKDSRGQLKYAHWDFPECHANDRYVMGEY
mgnify:CR=1 FL=1